MDTMNQELTSEQALSVLIQAARIAQKAGAFSLEDAEIVAKAIRVFIKTDNSQKAQESQQIKKES